MKQITLIFLSSLVGFILFSQDIAEDKKAIKSMCGCYEVKFNFAEVYSPDLGYDLKKPYSSQATEWITLIAEDNNSVSMQHILQVSEERIIKHWRQDWTFEDTVLLQYDHASRWHMVSVPSFKAKGTWTQRVFQVDDSPRYEGFGTWNHEEDYSYWESSSDAPLPRRDLTTRDDYNVMHRRNRHTIYEGMHLHEEDNSKIYRSAKYGDEVIAIEKGYNTYKKVDDSRCEFAKKWWEENQQFWALVREEWTKLIADKTEISLDFEDGKNADFYKAMFGLGKNVQAEGKLKTKEVRNSIQDLLEDYYIEKTAN